MVIYRWIKKNGIENHLIDQDSEEPQNVYIYGKGVESETATEGLDEIQELFNEFDLFVGEHHLDYTFPLDHGIVEYTSSGDSRGAAKGDIILFRKDNSYYVLTTAHLVTKNHGEIKNIERDKLSYGSETASEDGMAIYDWYVKKEEDDTSHFFEKCLHDTLVFKIPSLPSDRAQSKEWAKIHPIRNQEELSDPNMAGVQVWIDGKKGTVEMPFADADNKLKHHLRFKMEDGDCL